MSVPERDQASDELEEIRTLARPLRTTDDLDPLLERVGDARFVLVGEASHGTADYYGWRAALTRRLVVEQGFTVIAVEGDWPDCAEVDRWVRDEPPGRPGPRAPDARSLLAGFERWPTWMWANEEVADLVGWLREHNRSTDAPVGFYGLDVYSLWDSLRALLGYLREHRPEAVDAALEACRCFEPYGEDPQDYARATRLVPTSCEDDVVRLLTRLRADGDPDGGPLARLDAEQNAAVVAGAERYYRTMVRGDRESWNVRDHHMADTLDRLVAHHGPGTKVVVWAHNTHVGDARATDMARAGMVNVGQLVRERHAEDGVVLVGFGGYRGQVVAADFWGGPARTMVVPPAPPGTHEALLHEALGEPSLLVFPTEVGGSTWLERPRGHRAIGVVYRPTRDPLGNWVPTVMGRRYDAFASLDETEALHPLHTEVPQPRAELETYPWST